MMSKNSKSTTVGGLVIPGVSKESKDNRGEDTETMGIKYKVIKLLPETHELLKGLAEFKDESYDHIVRKCAEAFLREREKHGRSKDKRSK